MVRLLGAFILISCSPLHAFAASQSPRAASTLATVAGLVVDSSGAAVPSAEVTITSAAGERVVTRTGADGHFTAEHAGVGPFVVTVLVAGFAPAIEPDVDGRRELTLTLEPASIREQVNVISTRRRASIASTATRTDTPLLQVPQTIDIVDAGVLREQAATSMVDALKNVPGVNSNLGEGRRDQFLIRGFSAQNDTLLDGSRDDAPYYRDVATVERIEVVKGPAAALFGRGSSGGVINRILKSPRPDDSISEASISVGSLGARRFTGDVGRSAGSFSFRAAAAGEDSTSFRDDYYLRRLTVAPSILWTGVDTTALAQIEVLSDHRIPDRGIPSVDGRPADVHIGQTYGYPVDDFIDTSVVSSSVRVERRFATGLSVRQLIRFGVYDTSFSNTAPSGTALGTGGTWRVSRQQYNAEQSQANLFSQSEVFVARKFAGIGHLILGGVELGTQHRDMTRFNGTAASVPLIDPVLTRPIYSATAATNNRFTGTTVAVYFQDQLSFGDRWKGLAGVRGDRYDQTLDDRRPDNLDLGRTDATWSPRAGVVFQPTRTTSLYGTVSRSFQPSGEGLSLAVNAAELKPEESRNIEGGAKAELFGNRATATISVFRLDRTNIKTTDPVDPTRLVLVGHQRTTGTEVAVEGQLAARLRAQAGYALLDAAVLRSNTVTSGVAIEGNRPGLVPYHAANVWLHYVMTSRLAIAGGLTATGLRYTSNDNLVQLPGYARADAAVTYRRGLVEVGVNARNLFDTRYYETAGSNFQIFPGTPREVLVTVRVAR
jgi:catecholate siderophore receptor